MKKKSLRILALALLVCMAAGLFAGCSRTETVFIGGKDDLTGRKIGVQEGTTGDLLVTDQVADAEVLRYKKAVDAAIELKNGKIDAVVLDDLPAQKIVDSMPELTIIPERLSEEEYAIAVKKGNAELLDSINATIGRIKEDGTFDSFVKAFTPEAGTDAVPLPARPESTYTDTIVMGTNAEFEPFEYKEGDKIVGFDVEMAQEIANDLGRKLVIEDMAFDSLITALAAGKVDFVAAGLTVDDERKKNADFSDTYYSASQVIIVRKTSVKES